MRARSVQPDSFGMEGKPKITYGEPADVIGAYVTNADEDGVYVVNPKGEKYLIALNGQDKPIVRYE